jgi:hypothetical protein
VSRFDSIFGDCECPSLTRFDCGCLSLISVLQSVLRCPSLTTGIANSMHTGRLLVLWVMFRNATFDTRSRPVSLDQDQTLGAKQVPFYSAPESLSP